MLGQYQIERLSLNTPNTLSVSPRDDLLEASALVATLDLSAVALRLMNAPDGPKWDAETVAAAELRYRRFLLMTKLHPQAPLTPARDIDTFWHEHILNTRAYWRDCETLFGGYLHHDAGFGAEEKDFEVKAVLDDDTSQIYTSLFNEPYFNSDATASYCTISSCVVANADDATSKKPVVDRQAAYCTISSCVVANADDATSKKPVVDRQAAYCTISSCVVANAGDGTSKKPVVDRQAAYCTISSCVVANAGDGTSKKPVVDRRAAYCTISSCVVAKGDDATSNKPTVDRRAAYCTISSCVVAQSA
jgi:hypothetical protein